MRLIGPLTTRIIQTGTPPTSGFVRFSSPLCRAERLPPVPLRLGDARAAGSGLRPRRQSAMEAASPLTRLDPHTTGPASAVARATRGPLLPRQTQSIAAQTDCAQPPTR